MSNENLGPVAGAICKLATIQDATIRELRLEVIGLREQNRKLVEALEKAREVTQ